MFFENYFITTQLKTHQIRFLTFWILFLISCHYFSQQTYFQQEVNYTIDAKLNDVQHSLSAFEKIQYINNSPNTLHFIYFHLWPNAYKNKSTALAKQFLQQGNTTFHFSSDEEKGYLDSLDFKINGLAIRWEFDSLNSDICKLYLNTPLEPKGSLTITTPFFLKIPDAKFSRLGHNSQAYFITQWYPKPAVYDNAGWHPMPYLDQGEFYSEFGSFEVSITVPKNYVLAATGDRMDSEAEDDFLNNKVIETLKHLDNNTRKENAMDFPESSKEFKTVRFKQYNVHDFAWFADKRFYVLHDQIELPLSKRTVDTWSFFTDKNFDLWKESISYLNDATLFYSHLLGDYPYKHVTAVDGTIMAGGGMEYPNITVIGDATNAYDLDITITHEVGHNWFYGILANNERDHPALDEGINSFYEMRYARAKYPHRKLSDYIGRDSTSKLMGLNKIEGWKEREIAYYLSAKSNNDQPINLSSGEFTEFNYGSIIYSKTALVFDYLMEYMGEASFDEAMRFYFTQFKYKHPSFNDLFKTLGYYSGTNLDLFEKDFFNSTKKIDYRIKRVKRNKDGSYTLKLKNKTGFVTPFNVYGYKDNKPVGVVWFNGFEKTKEISFVNKEVDYFKLDGNDKLQDVNRKNNIIKAKGLFRKLKPLQISIGSHIDNPKKTQLNFVPFFCANVYNGFMLGGTFNNYSITKKPFEFAILPMYAFRSKTPVGFAEINYNFFPKEHFKYITLGAKGRSFAYDNFDATLTNPLLGTNYKNMNFNYYRITPYIELEIKKKKATSNLTQLISYSSNQLFMDSLVYVANSATSSLVPTSKNVYSVVNQLNYSLSNKRILHPFHLNFNLQHTTSMAKTSVTFNYKITTGKNHFVDLRAFAGTFVAGNRNDRGYYAFRSAGYNGYHDYLFEGNYIGRNEFTGVGFSQFMEKDGALKVWTPLGQSSEWMLGFNIKSPKLFIIPVKLFADAVVCDGRSLNEDKFLWDAGINFSIWPEVIDVYFPLFYSNDIRKTLDLNNISFFNRIRFTFNIHKLDPKNFITNNLF